MKVFITAYAVIGIIIVLLSAPIIRGIIRYQADDREIGTDRTIVTAAVLCGALWVIAPLFWVCMLINAWAYRRYYDDTELDPEDAEDLEDDEIDLEEDEYL